MARCRNNLPNLRQPMGKPSTSGTWNGFEVPSITNFYFFSNEYLYQKNSHAPLGYKPIRYLGTYEVGGHEIDNYKVF